MGGLFTFSFAEEKEVLTCFIPHLYIEEMLNQELRSNHYLVLILYVRLNGL